MVNEKQVTKKPLIFAHRGASADRPEHTMDAYEEGLRQGADGFECDVRLTKDNVMVLWHDSTMDRTAGATGDIANLTFNEIRDRYPKVATLDELLDFVLNNKKGLLIETKHPVPTGRAIERAVSATLKNRKSEIDKAGVEISVMSFSWLAIESFKRDNSECQYCGTKKDLTLDHVIPSSRGGAHSWLNLVTACKRCNAKKGDYTPEEAGMIHKKKPHKPSYAIFLKDYANGSVGEWDDFLDSQN